MNLADFLATNSIKRVDFAKRIGLSEASVSRLATGRQMPSLVTIQAIERETGGEVTAADFNPKRRAA